MGDEDRTRLLVAGSRSITDYELLRRIFLRGPYKPHDSTGQYEIVHGACPTGVDQLAQRYAERWDLPVEAFPADWDDHGRGAGPIRNREMAEYGDVLIALWDGDSTGTKNMIDTALDHDLQVHVYQPTHLRDGGG